MTIRKMRKVLVLSAFFLYIFSVSQSCKKTGELTPSNTVADLNAVYTDTTTVKTVSLFNDSLVTDEVSRSLFGVFNDPIFGTTIATNYVQMNLTTTQLEFPEGAVVDSVVLKVVFDNAYGNLKSTVVLNVKELDENLIFENSYGNNSRAKLKSEILGTINFLPDFTDTTFADTTISSPHARIKLNTELGERILNHGLFEGNTDFIDFFKGICLEPDTTSLPPTGEGLITSFNFLSGDSKLSIYYNFPGENSTIQYGTYNLIVGDDRSPRFSNFRHKYDGAPVLDDINKQNLEVSYVQPLGGIRTRIDFPNLKNFLKPDQVVINKAELIIYVADGTIGEYPPPNKLIVLSEEDDGTDNFLLDYFEGSSYFGGNYDVNTNSYRFNIARYIDGLVNEDVPDNGLFLLVSGSSVVANRLILNSGSAQTNRMKINITYTQL